MTRIPIHTTLPLAAVLLAALSALAQAPGLAGNWRTPTGSIVQVHPCGDALCLRVVAIEKNAPGTLDENNPNPALRARSICGLEIGTGFHPDSSSQAADNGQIYDPKSGKTYSSSIAVNGPDRLKLRGYVGVKLFGRTEEWTRDTNPVPPCK